jgi:hypothetical protein
MESKMPVIKIECPCPMQTVAGQMLDVLKDIKRDISETRVAVEGLNTKMPSKAKGAAR